MYYGARTLRILLVLGVVCICPPSVTSAQDTCTILASTGPRVANSYDLSIPQGIYRSHYYAADAPAFATLAYEEAAAAYYPVQEHTFYPIPALARVDLVAQQPFTVRVCAGALEQPPRDDITRLVRYIFQLLYLFVVVGFGVMTAVLVLLTLILLRVRQ